MVPECFWVFDSAAHLGRGLACAILYRLPNSWEQAKRTTGKLRRVARSDETEAPG